MDANYIECRSAGLPGHTTYIPCVILHCSCPCDIQLIFFCSISPPVFVIILPNNHISHHLVAHFCWPIIPHPVIVETNLSPADWICEGPEVLECHPCNELQLVVYERTSCRLSVWMKMSVHNFVTLLAWLVKLISPAKISISAKCPSLADE